MIFGTRKVESLGYRNRMVKKIAEKFNRLSRVHQRHRQTDNRQTTDGRPIAYSERNLVRSLKTSTSTSSRCLVIKWAIKPLYFVRCVIATAVQLHCNFVWICLH